MATADKPEIKLPLFGHLEQLKPLPEQDPSRTFAISTAISPAPEGSAGYLVELNGKRNARVFAWLRSGGDAFACDGPISARPDREPEFYLRGRDGTGTATVCIDGRSSVVANWKQFPEHDNRVVLSGTAADLGPYEGPELDVDVTLAIGFLAFYQFPTEQGGQGAAGGNPWRTTADLLSDLRDAPYPDALDALMYRGSVEGTVPFERLATHELVAAGAERVRAIAARHSIELRRLSSTNLFWTAAPVNDMDDADVDTLQAVEGALNRLVLLDSSLSRDGASATLASLTEEAVVKAEQAIFTSLVDEVPARLRACEERNPFAKVCGAECERGGEWDVRTRFADAAERLRAPFNFLYTFDCDVREGVFEIHASLPTVSAFPQLEGIDSAQVRSAYALRFAALLASVAFGSSVGIIRTRIVLHERNETGTPLLALTLSRRVFSIKITALVKSGQLSDPRLQAHDLLELLEPEEQAIALDADGGLTAVEAPAPILPARPTMGNDTREVSPAVTDLLHVDRVCDLDIYNTDDDTLRERLNEILANTDPGDPSAIPALQDIISALDAADMLEDDGRRPLYCSDMVARVMAGADEPANSDLRFRKVPDTAYDARSALCRAYRELGNYEDSIRLGRELVELAPTAFTAWHSLALSCNEADRPSEAIEALFHGLLVTGNPADVAVAYYRLAFFIWQAGDAPLGLACYVMVPRNSPFGPQAMEEMGNLMRENNISTPPTRGAAESILRANNIPVAPVSALCERAAASAICLADAGFPAAAQNLVLFLSTIDTAPNGRDVLSAVSRSMAASV